ncbi:MAG: hypothetical protein ACFFCG_06480 [Promethearchaeota archaeon]
MKNLEGRSLIQNNNSEKTNYVPIVIAIIIGIIIGLISILGLILISIYNPLSGYSIFPGLLNTLLVSLLIILIGISLGLIRYGIKKILRQKVLKTDK